VLKDECCTAAQLQRDACLPMNEAELMNSLYSKHDFGHVKACDVLSEDFVLDEHSHQIATRQKLHEHIKESVILKSCMQLDHPRTVRFGKDVAFRTNMGKLVFFEL
jgi:hypothetical protein